MTVLSIIPIYPKYIFLRTIIFIAHEKGDNNSEIIFYK